MSTVRAHPEARRQAIVFVVATATLGTVLILAVNYYGEPLRHWVLSDPHAAPRRLRVLFGGFAVAASAPLIVFAAYLWRLGRAIVRAGQFPPPGQPVVRDIETVEGPAALARGRALKVFAALIAAFCLGFWLILWRLASFIRPAG